MREREEERESERARERERERDTGERERERVREREREPQTDREREREIKRGRERENTTTQPPPPRFGGPAPISLPGCWVARAGHGFVVRALPSETDCFYGLGYGLNLMFGVWGNLRQAAGVRR